MPPPAFDPDAHGVPADWNDEVGSRLCWGHRAKRRCGDLPAAAARPDVGVVLEFLRKRLGANGLPVRDLLGPPLPQGDGWTSLAWLGLAAEERAALEERGWERVDHRPPSLARRRQRRAVATA